MLLKRQIEEALKKHAADQRQARRMLRGPAAKAAHSSSSSLSVGQERL